MRQEGVINQMREASLERAKIAGRTAQQHVDMMNKAALEAVGAALKAPVAVPASEVPVANPTQSSPASAAQPSSVPAAVAPPAVVSAPISNVSQPPAAAPVPQAVPQATPVTQVAEQPKFQNKQVEVSWNTIRESEKQIAAQRAQFLQEKASFEAEKVKLMAPNPELQTLQQLQQGLKSNLAGTLKSLGYNAAQIAEVALSLNGTPAQQQQPVVQPVQQPQWQQPASAKPAEPPPEIAELKAKYAQLEQTALTLQNFVITQQYNSELAKPEFELLRAMPDALDRAIGAWQSHHTATGRPLSTQEACARAQEELVAAKKAEFERLNSNPAWSKALGSLAQPSGAPPTASMAQSGEPGAAPAITSLSANLAPSGPVPPVTATPATQWLPPDEQRRLQAIERARKAGESAQLAR